MNEVQVVCTVVSTNKKSDPDIAAMIGTSAALAISGIPFAGPIGAARVGFHPEIGYILNPTYEQLQSSSLDMVVAGTEDAVLMVESEADELTEDQMLGAVLFAHDEFQAVIRAVKELAAEAGKPAWDWKARRKTPCWSTPSRQSWAKRSPRPIPSPSSRTATTVWASCATRPWPCSPARKRASSGFRGQGRIRPAGIPHRSREHRQRQAAYRRS